MFDSVSREKYEQERDARVRAETLAEQLTARLKDEQERVTDLLDRLFPKPEKPPLFTGGSRDSFLSSQQIARMLAVGKRGVRERNSMLAEAKAREEQEEKEDRLSERKATLTDEEEAQLEEVINK